MKRINKESIALGIILLIALSIRVWGLNYDLPQIYHADEPFYVTISQNIFRTGDLNPHFFNYPSLFFYINSLAYIPYYLFGKFVGIFTSPNDILSPISLAMGVNKSPMPTTILLGRIITVIFGVGTVGLVFVIGKRLTRNLAVGLLASLIMVFSPSNVIHSRFITPDTFVAFFATASFLAMLLVYQQGKTWHYIMAGVCIGLTASSKYNGGLIMLSLPLAHFLRHGKIGLKKRNLYLALLFCGLGFIATTPYALLDFSEFLADLKFESQHYATGHSGMEGDTLRWYLNYMWQTANVVYILATLEILRGAYSQSKETILLSSFPLLYFAFINTFVVRNDRTFLPLTPFLFLLAASFSLHLLYKFKNLQSKTLRQFSIFAIASLLAISLSVSASKTITNTIQLTTGNTREIARVWINSNLPSDAKIAIEPYSPFVDTSQFSVQGFRALAEHEPEWYLEQGFDYLVFSEGMYGRFYREPEKYEVAISYYENLFREFHPMMLFADGDYEIRVYQVR